MYGFIYITTNLVNNKRYIGQCSYNKVRTEFYLGSGKHILAAIKKYGKENFTREVLCEAETLEELNRLERHYIKEYNAVKSREFYNVSPGGKASLGFTGKKHTKERNEDLSRRYMGHKVSDRAREAVGRTGKITSKKMNSTTVTCPHCSKIGNLGPMHRWHFDNCKLKL